MEVLNDGTLLRVPLVSTIRERIDLLFSESNQALKWELLNNIEADENGRITLASVLNLTKITKDRAAIENFSKDKTTFDAVKDFSMLLKFIRFRFGEFDKAS